MGNNENLEFDTRHLHHVLILCMFIIINLLFVNIINVCIKKLDYLVITLILIVLKILTEKLSK